MSTFYDVAIIGATGIVGETFFSLLEERRFPVRNIYALASARSAGDTVVFQNKSILVQDVAEFDFSTVQLAFFSAGNEVSRQYVPLAAKVGCTVIDNSSAFRYDDDIPLIVPEVNAHVLAKKRNCRIIANPNCSTVQLVVALKPIVDYCGVSRVNVATYQSVSGAGREAIHALAKETTDLLNGQAIENPVLAKQIAFNLFPHIDAFQENGYTREEMKMVWETQKILQDSTISVNPTTVRVPVFFGHSEAVHLETKKKASAAEIKAILQRAPGVIVVDSPDYPTPVTHAANQDAVFVGRIREDISHDYGINLWIVSDNVRKGAALNAIQIAELFIKKNHYLH